MLLTELDSCRQEGNFSMLPRKTKACDRLQAFKACFAKGGISGRDWFTACCWIDLQS